MLLENIYIDSTSDGQILFEIRYSEFDEVHILDSEVDCIEVYKKSTDL